MIDLFICWLFVRSYDAFLTSDIQHNRTIDTAAVITDQNHNATALLPGRERECANAFLARCKSDLGCLQAVIQGVTHQVHKRVDHALEHGLVEFGGAPFDHKIHFLAKLL